MKRILLAGLFFFFLSPAHADILIGVSSPMTGSAAAYGQQAKDGIEAALAEINKTGVLKGQKIKAVYEDDGCEAKQGVAAANRLVSRGVVAVIGPLCSMATIPASSVYAEENIPEITISTHSDVTARGLNNVFRLNGRDAEQTAFLYAYLAKNYAGKRVALLHDKQVWGKSLVDNLEKEMNADKQKPVLIDSINAGDKDLSVTVSRLKKEKIDVVVMGLFPVEAGLLVRQAREQKLDTAFIGGDAILNNDFWKIADKMGEGVTFSGPFDPRQTKEGAAAVAQIKARKAKPELYTMYIYGCMQVVAQALEKAGSTDAKKITAILHNAEFDTLLGKVSFNEKGDMEKPMWKFYQWTKGDYKLLDGEI